MIARRSIITGLVALVAAPAIVKASSLMPVKVFDRSWPMSEKFIPMLTLDEYSERILQPMVGQLANQIADEMISGRGLDVLYGSRRLHGNILHIRLPNDFATSDGPGLFVQGPVGELREFRVVEGAVPLPDFQVAAGLALGVAAMTAMAVAPQVLAKPVTRRFWGK